MDIISCFELLLFQRFFFLSNMYLLGSFKQTPAFHISQRYQPNTRPDIGLCSLPNGQELYQQVLRWHLSVNMTAREIHDLGLQEVNRIHNEMDKVGLIALIVLNVEKVA